jgi:hypothetical protein
VVLPKVGAASAAGGAKTGALLALALIGTTLAQTTGSRRAASLWLITRATSSDGDHGRHHRPLEEGSVTNAMADLPSAAVLLHRRRATCCG